MHLQNGHFLQLPHIFACVATPFRSNRQKYFGDTAAILAGLATVYSTTYVAALADVLAEPNCGYPWLAMAGLEFVRVRAHLLYARGRPGQLITLILSTHFIFVQPSNPAPAYPAALLLLHHHAVPAGACAQHEAVEGRWRARHGCEPTQLRRCMPAACVVKTTLLKPSCLRLCSSLCLYLGCNSPRSCCALLRSPHRSPIVDCWWTDPSGTRLAPTSLWPASGHCWLQWRR